MTRLLFTVSFVFVALLSTDLALAEKASDSMMASQAMSPYIRSTTPASEKRERIREHHEKVRKIAASPSNEDRSATIVFQRGLTTEEFLEFVSEYELQVIDIHLKTPYDDDGVVQSIRVGASTLEKWSGTFDERAEKAIGSIRYQFMQWAESMPDDGDAESVEFAEAHNRMARTPWHIYRIEVYGKKNALRSCLSDSTVALVVPDKEERSESKVDSHKKLKQRFSSRRDAIMADRSRKKE